MQIEWILDACAGRKAYLQHLNDLYKQNNVSWFTPIEIFQARFFVIAALLVLRGNLYHPTNSFIPLIAVCLKSLNFPMGVQMDSLNAKSILCAVRN